MNPLSEAVLLEIVQQIKKLEEWGELPNRLTMPIPYACDICPRNLGLRSSIYSQGYSRREEYRHLTKDERAQLKKNAEKYFYYAKALLRSFRGVKGIEPYATFKVLPACPHVQMEESKLSIRFGEELRQSIKPLADLMVKIISDEEQNFKQIINSPYLMAYYVDGRYEGLRLICEDCTKREPSPQAIMQSARIGDEKAEFPCRTLDDFSISDCLSQQLRAWLKSNEFELKDDIVGVRPLHMIPNITLATKDERNYLVARSFFSIERETTKLKRLNVKVYGLIAKEVIPLLLELPLEDNWLAYDLGTDQLIRSSSLTKLSDVSIERLIELIVHQNIGKLDHDAIKEVYTQLGVDQGYITGEELRVEGGATDVAWYDKDRQCVVAMEVETSAGASLAKDIYKMKSLAPKIMVLVIKKGRNIDTIRNYSKETDGLPLLVMFPEYSWILFEQGNVTKLESLKPNKLT